MQCISKFKNGGINMLASIVLDRVEYVTLYTGNNGSGACTCKCPCCSQKGRDRRYQGTINQVLDMFDSLPNIKQLYIFGNPDISVDTEFCKRVAKEAVKRNIRVCFSTSGIGGKKVVTKLLDCIPKNMVDYISFSFDAITKEEMSFMKGINYPMEKALEGLDWALEEGYIVKVQPTLWSCNYMKTEEIIDFFVTRGVKWFTFHIGSLESEIYLPSHKHLIAEEIEEVHKQISNAVCNYPYIKVRCPIIYARCGSNEPNKWYCMHPERTKELLVMLTEEGIKATHTPMASNFKENLTFDISKEKSIIMESIPENNFCPYSYKLSGQTDTCCRYVSKYWNY